MCETKRGYLGYLMKYMEDFAAIFRHCSEIRARHMACKVQPTVGGCESRQAFDAEVLRLLATAATERARCAWNDEASCSSMRRGTTVVLRMKPYTSRCVKSL